ncbi:MAG: hypothetical protein JWP74_1774 [Marmoricola sp.]|nr:hypothetical protein [Marmoricola sp.]
MAGFTDLIPRARPSLNPDGVPETITENCDYSRIFPLFDDAGTAVNMTGGTVTVTVRDTATGAAVLVSGSPIFTGTVTTTGFTVTTTAAITANLVSGLTSLRYAWSCSLTLSSKTVQAWNPDDSPLTIKSN